MPTPSHVFGNWGVTTWTWASLRARVEAFFISLVVVCSIFFTLRLSVFLLIWHWILERKVSNVAGVGLQWISSQCNLHSSFEPSILFLLILEGRLQVQFACLRSAWTWHQPPWTALHTTNEGLLRVPLIFWCFPCFADAVCSAPGGDRRPHCAETQFPLLAFVFHLLPRLSGRCDRRIRG